MSIIVKDEQLDAANRLYYDTIVRIVSERYPSIYAEAKASCNSRMGANSPCDGCLLEHARKHGLGILS